MVFGFGFGLERRLQAFQLRVGSPRGAVAKISMYINKALQRQESLQ